jgi:hypothetical protein
VKPENWAAKSLVRRTQLKIGERRAGELGYRRFYKFNCIEIRNSPDSFPSFKDSIQKVPNKFEARSYQKETNKRIIKVLNAKMDMEKYALQLIIVSIKGRYLPAKPFQILSAGHFPRHRRGSNGSPGKLPMVKHTLQQLFHRYVDASRR